MIKQILIFALLVLSYVPSDAGGISYEHLSDGGFYSIHVLVVDPKEHILVPVKAHGRETVAALAKRHHAIAAVNGGFWKPNGDPAGILKIDHHWYGTPIKPRGAIGWTGSGQKVCIGRVLTNRHLGDTGDADKIKVIPISTPPYQEDWEQMEHIVGGTPVLVKDGNVIKDYTSEQTLESFLINKHPRTAVGIRNNGEWVFVVVDGRFYGFLGGMTMNELAELMLKLDCSQALNLDGGGSSTMVLQGTVVGEPCGKILDGDKWVEAVSDAILIF